MIFPCMTADERDGWDFWNIRSGPARAPLPCCDCTPEYMTKMRSAELCHGSLAVRYCASCKKWTPDTNEYWVTMHAAGSPVMCRGTLSTRRTADLRCRTCQHRRQNALPRVTLSDEVRHERRLASWRKYQAKRSGSRRQARAAA